MRCAHAEQVRVSQSAAGAVNAAAVSAVATKVHKVNDSRLRWQPYKDDTIWTTVNSPVQWNLYKDYTIGTTVDSHA